MLRDCLIAVRSAARLYRKRAGFLVLLTCTEAALLYGLKWTSQETKADARHKGVVPARSTRGTALAPTYRVTELGMPADTYAVYAAALAKNGEVVGRLLTKRGPRAFVWQKGHYSVLTEKQMSVAYGTNGRGIVVGELVEEDGVISAAVAWTKGREQRLFHDRNGSFAIAVNDRGDIYGHHVEAGRSRWQAYVRSKEGHITLLDDDRTGRSSFVKGISSRGDVALSLLSPSADRMTAALYHNGKLTVLPAPDNAVANAVNNRAEVVGWINNKANGASPTLWRNGKIVSLPIPKSNGAAQDINDRSDIVGFVSSRRENDFYGEAFVIHDGKFAYLNDLIGGTPWLNKAIAIDSSGDILVEGRSADGKRQTYLLTRK